MSYLRRVFTGLNRVRALSGIQVAFLISAAHSSSQAASQQLTIEISDYATMPITGQPQGGKTSNTPWLSRVNFLREEPGGHKPRLFVNDLNGPLYILDKQSRAFAVYLNFNGNGGQPGVFHKLTTERGFANGFVNFIFDPDYEHNGKFYSIHIEDPALPGSALPDNTNFPGLRVNGYTLSAPVQTPGPTKREAVVIEWTDSNTSDAKFEGTARELMRVHLNTESHPMGGLIFNPTAKRGDPDWRVLYIACGDGRSGESMDLTIRQNPQRLDNFEGKILRIVPDFNDHKNTSTVSENGRYRVPNDNPFVSISGARKEIWAYGLRNPNRLSWYFDPSDPKKNTLLVSVVGLGTWETVDIVHKGANYGYSLREGNEQLEANNKTTKLPEIDKIPIRVDATATAGTVTPTYPVLQYGHVKTGGDAVSSGFVYGGSIEALRRKFIFGDITTGRIWYATYADMLAADDGDPRTMAEMHEVRILWDKPRGAKELYGTMAPVTEAAYHQRGGKSAGLPGRATISGGRSDIRFCMDEEGELYILSKSDGMIRMVTGATLSGVEKTEAVSAPATVAASEGATRSVWEGVYTADQSIRGKVLYDGRCASCHGEKLDGGEGAPPLAGAEFLANFGGKTVGDLFERTRTTMPADKPGSLSEQEYADILVYLLDANKFPAGSTELPAHPETLKQIRIETEKQKQ